MIIDKLIKKKYCFAVMKSYSYLTKNKIYQNEEWEILALEKDFLALNERGFERFNDHNELPRTWMNPKGIISRTMERKEVTEFKNYKAEYFSIVYETPYGIIYELKDFSFKKEYERQLLKNLKPQNYNTDL